MFSLACRCCSEAFDLAFSSSVVLFVFPLSSLPADNLFLFSLCVLDLLSEFSRVFPAHTVITAFFCKGQHSLLHQKYIAVLFALSLLCHVHSNDGSKAPTMALLMCVMTDNDCEMSDYQAKHCTKPSCVCMCVTGGVCCGCVQRLMRDSEFVL